MQPEPPHYRGVGGRWWFRAGRLAARAAVALALQVGASMAPAQTAQPSKSPLFVPASDSEVVEVLATSPVARAALASRGAPENFAAAAMQARRHIDAARAEGDPRFLGLARAALLPWWQDQTPELLLLRATILQSSHQFDAALADLDRLLVLDPRSAQGWLTRATIELVLGRYPQALQSCLRLQALMPDQLPGLACVAEARSLTGDRHAYAGLQQRLAAAVGDDRATRGWLYLLLAEMAERQGQPADAERSYRLSLALSPSLYARAALADLLLAGDRPQQALELVEQFAGGAGAGADAGNRSDPQLPDVLLLRKVLALKALGRNSDLRRASDQQRARFADAHSRGDSQHGREEARFRLVIDGDARAALALARSNWMVQKEPADVLVLAQAARAAGDERVLAELRGSLAQTGFADARLMPLLAQTR